MNTMNEYVTLYNFYLNKQEAKCKLEKKYQEALERLATYYKTMKDRLETKSLEFKQLKSEIDNVKKDKNSLYVALRAARSQSKEQRKDFEKKKTKLENVILELNDFIQLKLAEERKETMKRRKELKRANQKLKKESIEILSKILSLLKTKN
jgi:chromosome segregation ATPase